MKARDDDIGKANEPHLDPFTESLLEYASDAVRALAASKSSRKLPKPSGILRELAWPINGPVLKVSDLGYKRPRGGREFGKHQPSQFFMDPNKVAAAIAASLVEDLKARRADGSMSNTHERAARYCVQVVNELYIHLLPRFRKADVETVKGLLRQGRTKWPSGKEY